LTYIREEIQTAKNKNERGRQNKIKNKNKNAYREGDIKFGMEKMNHNIYKGVSFCNDLRNLRLIDLKKNTKF